MSLTIIIIAVIAGIALLKWMFNDMKRCGAVVAIAFIVIIGFKLADAPKTEASGGNPLASIMLSVLPASADTSVLSTKVNGVGAADGLKKGGLSKAIGADGFNL